MIDQESKNFIKWSMEKLEDEEFFFMMMKRIKSQQVNFYRTPRKRLLQILRTKMEEGAQHYGEPIKSSRRLRREIREEFLDLIGWNMLTFWALHRKRIEI